MNIYRVDYFSKRINAYTYKLVYAKDYESAIKKAKIKNIEEIVMVGIVKNEKG